MFVSLFVRKMEAIASNHFLYYAYGSNLLKKRIRINNPSAEFVGIGRLSGHRLDFIRYGKRWKGASATIVPVEQCSCVHCKNNHVWGAIWKLHIDDMPALDRQEGVAANYYFAKQVEVTNSNGEILECRTYQQTTNPEVSCGNNDVPVERRPSITYLKCIIEGAIECELPEEYIMYLKSIPNNGEVSNDMESQLFQR